MGFDALDPAQQVDPSKGLVVDVILVRRAIHKSPEVGWLWISQSRGC